VLTILLGPFLALLPKSWRDSLPALFSPHWRLATILSGFAESAIALFAMAMWYSYSMSTWVSRGLDSATGGGLALRANEQEIGFAAVTIFAMHPWTWVIAYFAVEGTVRLLGAAISGTPMGTLPLVLVDKVMAKITGRDRANHSNAAGGERSNVSSYAEAIRQKVLTVALPEVPDEICARRSGSEEILEIRASRTKQDWVPPRVVRYGDAYYRLEETTKGSASRPFAYVLRRLPAGVPGRRVLLYQPATPPFDAKN
jgi:hypothetical protein